MFGLTVEEATVPPTEIFADELMTVNVFIAMGTQWRVSMGGATGLDYAALPAVMGLVGVPKADRAYVFEGVRIMEDAALEFMHREK